MIESDSRHVIACPRVKAAKVWHLIPARYIEQLEQNQGLASCCRHPENHDFEAWYSNAEVAASGDPPDIYKFHCTSPATHHEWGPDHDAALKLKSGMRLDPTDGVTCRICQRTTTFGQWKNIPDDCEPHTCGRVQPRFCVGGGDERPFWEIR